MTRPLILLATAVALTSCGSPQPAAPPDGQTTDAPAAPAPADDGADDGADEAGARAIVASLPAPYSAADLANGHAKFAACRACHTVAKGGAAMIGPNLWGVFGRKAGTVEGFAYSPALKGAGFAWEPASIDRWIDDPARMLPGTKMTFAGLKNANDRRDVIAYLASQTQDPPAAK